MKLAMIGGLLANAESHPLYGWWLKVIDTTVILEQIFYIIRGQAGMAPSKNA